MSEQTHGASGEQLLAMMEQEEDTGGVIRVKLKPRPLGSPPLGFLLSLPLLALPFGGWLVESGLLVLARCSFKTMFGLPCMGCGATRATLNVLHGDWLEALFFQPLVLTIYTLVALWGVTSLVLYIRGEELEVHTATWLTWTLRIGLLALPFINWVYLVSLEI
ncbi:MAG: hypothetical protein CMH57_04965 [Myxococcales bacterium]|nr:hypothetical protein [Myxococcales bacterium]